MRELCRGVKSVDVRTPDDQVTTRLSHGGTVILVCFLSNQ
jgi:hypothetical protein